MRNDATTKPAVPRFILIATALLLLMTVWGCKKDDKPDNSAQQAALALALASSSSGGSGSGGGSGPAPSLGWLRISLSSSGIPITHTYIALSTSSSWGFNRGAISPGQTRTWSLQGNRYYDIRTDLNNGNTQFFWDRYVAVGQTVTINLTGAAIAADAAELLVKASGDEDAPETYSSTGYYEYEDDQGDIHMYINIDRLIDSDGPGDQEADELLYSS